MLWSSEVHDTEIQELDPDFEGRHDLWRAKVDLMERVSELEEVKRTLQRKVQTLSTSEGLLKSKVERSEKDKASMRHEIGMKHAEIIKLTRDKLNYQRLLQEERRRADTFEEKVKKMHREADWFFKGEDLNASPLQWLRTNEFSF